jgi:hypothetical protein
MSTTPENKERAGNQVDQFANAAEEQQMGLVREFWDFLLHNKKWWITPIVVVLLLVGILAYLSASAPAIMPFIYTIF